MTEKIGTIKNPLTIIAIFAGIAEVSGTLVLPFISDNNQMTFIYFLITFPLLLIFLFFGTLNFNNKALYAPSDFTNEDNYIKIFKYNFSKQENVEVRVSQEELMQIMNKNLEQIKIHYENKIDKLEVGLKELRSQLENSKTIEAEIVEDIEDNEEFFDDEAEGLITVLKFPNSRDFTRKLVRKGYLTEIYEDETDLEFKHNKAIWLGYKVPLKTAKDVILTAIENYPHIEYIELSNRSVNNPPFYIHTQIFIGGSTKTAIDNGLKKVPLSDWDDIKNFKTLKQLHDFINKYH
jgi:hypothetical protein